VGSPHVVDVDPAAGAGDGVDLVHELARWALQELIEVEAAERIGAGRYERSGERVTERNGHRSVGRMLSV
jgi:transposase-like protein